MIAVLEKPQASKADRGLRYGSAVTCTAAGVDKKTLNNWLSRQPAVVLLTDEERREAGERNRFSFDRNRVMQIALTAELVRLGVQPRRAAMCAAAFTDTAEGKGAYPDLEQRRPGELFEGVLTFLVVPPGEANPKVVPVTESTGVIDLMRPAYGHPLSTAILLNVNEIFDRVRSVLSSTN